jgi:hypothetical protein
LTSFTEPPDFGRSAIGIQQTRLRWIRKGLQVAYLLAALLPAAWVLSHPMPVAWLRPICKDTWPILATCAMAAILPLLFRRAGAGAWSLSVIALTQATFQAWCYNTGSHPAHNSLQVWGIFPLIDSHMYYTAACEVLNGQQITSINGARHPYPLLLAVLLKLFGHNFRTVTFVFTIVMALATWSAFEVIRIRLGGLAATVYLACVTFYIRVHCTGLFMPEQMALLYSICAAGMLVESVTIQGKAKPWLYCIGLFFVTQALNARPGAYITLPFLVLASWPLFRGNRKARVGMVALGGTVVAISLLVHGITYHRAIAIRSPSNVWYCIYGMLNNGTWADGRKRSQELLQNKPGLVNSDWREGRRLLREECLSEIKDHPGKFLGGWWRAVQFLWSRNIPFRAADPEMPSVWFTESARWCTVVGVALSLFFLLRIGRLSTKFKVYQALSWLNLATLLGMVASLPFAPPWDGETRIFAATLPLFFLLPACGVGGLYLLTVSRFHQKAFKAGPNSQQQIAIGSALIIGGTLSLVTLLASWCLIDTSGASKNRSHPVASMKNDLGKVFTHSFDLRSLQAGYHLRVTDDTQPTWLPNISRKDFLQNVPGGPGYSSLSSAFSQLPPGTEVVVLPYWVFLVLDNEDAQAQTFTPRPEQMGHIVWPPVYFSKRLPFQDR